MYVNFCHFSHVIFFFINLVSMGIRESDKGIGPWATSKDAREPDENQVLMRASRLLGQGRGLVTTNG